MISGGVVLLVTFLLLLIEPFEPLRLGFEAVSALATVGLSTGITPELTPFGKIIITAAFCMGLFLVPAAWAASAGNAVILIVMGCLAGLATANIMVILQGCAPPGEIGVWTGAENFVGNLAGVLAPLVMGFLISITGSYRPGFVLGAFILLAGILSYWLVVGDMKPQAKQVQG